MFVTHTEKTNKYAVFQYLKSPNCQKNIFRVESTKNFLENENFLKTFSENRNFFQFFLKPLKTFLARQEKKCIF